jgi:hypothetical protein
MSRKHSQGKSIFAPKKPNFFIYDKGDGQYQAMRFFGKGFTYAKLFSSIEEAYAFLKRQEFAYTPEEIDLKNLAPLT